MWQYPGGELPPRPLNRKKVHVNKANSSAPVGPSWRHLAVGPIPPADWGTRSTRSHLSKRPEHEVTDFCPRRGGAGGAPRSGPDLPERGWGPRGLGFEAVPGGVPTGSTSGGRGRPEERHLRGQNVASKAGRIQGAKRGHCATAVSSLALLLRRSHQSPGSG
jgi:hypothetical protein